MIFRFHVWLGYRPIVPTDPPIDPVELEFDGMRCRVWPPIRSRLRASDLADGAALAPLNVGPRLLDAEPTVSDGSVLNGAPAMQANTLRVDVLGDFDRGDETVPPVELGLHLANEVLMGLRTVVRGGFIRPLMSMRTIWAGRYLRDDETEFTPQQGLKREVQIGIVHLDSFAIVPEIWATTTELISTGSRERPPWQTLLLDASSMADHRGASLVLALAAIETRIEALLDDLPRESSPSHCGSGSMAAMTSARPHQPSSVSIRFCDRLPVSP